MIISKKVQKIILEDIVIIAKIAAQTNKSFQTAERYVRDRSPRLTEIGILEVLEKSLSMTRDEILVEA